MNTSELEYILESIINGQGKQVHDLIKDYNNRDPSGFEFFTEFSAYIREEELEQRYEYLHKAILYFTLHSD